MTYEKFLEEVLSKGLLRRQISDLRSVQRLVLRAYKDLRTAKANLEIDEGIAYTVAYLAMLHAARAFMLLKGSVRRMGISIEQWWSSYLVCWEKSLG